MFIPMWLIVVAVTMYVLLHVGAHRADKTNAKVIADLQAKLDEQTEILSSYHDTVMSESNRLVCEMNSFFTVDIDEIGGVIKEVRDSLRGLSSPKELMSHRVAYKRANSK